MNTVTVNGKLRTATGKKATKAIRNEERIPCVMYGGDNVIHFSATFKDVKPLIYTAGFSLAAVEIDGTAYKCILKSAQFHPVTDEVLHMDFLQLVDGKPFKVQLPAVTQGKSSAEISGGKLVRLLHKVDVKTTPEYLVDKLIIDIEGLKLGQALRIRDLQLPEGIEVLNPSGSPIVKVEIPRIAKSLLSAEEEGEGVEGEEGTEVTDEAKEAPTAE